MDDCTPNPWTGLYISWPLLPDNALPSCIAILLPPLLSPSSRCPGRRMVFRSIAPWEEAREGRLNWKYVIRQCVKSSVSFRILLRLSPSETCRFLFYRAEPPVPSWRKNVSRVDKFLAYFSSLSSFPTPFWIDQTCKKQKNIFVHRFKHSRIRWSKKSSKIYTTNVPRELNPIHTRGKYRCVKFLRVYERDPP